MYKYKKIGLGGTFDHFHRGHQVFIMQAAQLAEELVIGITTASMVQEKKFSQQIESFEDRHQAVKQFTRNLLNTVSLVPLTDHYGPTLEGSTVQAIAATTDTRKGAEAINNKRAQLQLSKLPIHLFELQAADDGQPISSARIRAGAISRQGFVYASLFQEDLVLSEKQKKYFSKPQGKIISQPSPANYTFVVGDKSLQTFQENNWHYQLGIFDHKTKRQPVKEKINLPARKVANPAGKVSHQLTVEIASALENQHRHLFIEGEEDLAAVALLLLAPLGSHIYYGQPNRGIVEMIVTEKKKEECAELLKSNDQRNS